MYIHKKISIYFIVVLPFLFCSESLYAEPIEFDIQELESYLSEIKNIEFTLKGNDEELSVQKDLWVPQRELSASGSEILQNEEGDHE